MNWPVYNIIKFDDKPLISLESNLPCQNDLYKPIKKNLNNKQVGSG